MFSRIATAIDLAAMEQSHVTVIGAGGSATLIGNLFRSGLGAATLVDPQTVELPNIARQDHHADLVGVPKVKALAHHVRSRINANARVTEFPVDFCALNDEEIDAHFAATDLFIFGTDSFKAQSRGNEVALRLGKPAIWVGLYRGAGAGEIVFWHPEIDACFQCLCSKRYAAHAAAEKDGRSLDPPSDGATIMDIALLDSIVGMLAIGVLTRGADNRFGRLIDQLGTGANARNFIQVKIDPEWTLNGQDVVRKQLGVPDGRNSYFAWNAIVLQDSPICHSHCTDCAKFRGHYWKYQCKILVGRLKPGDPDYTEADAARALACGHPL